MPKYGNFDFDRAQSLMDFVVSAGQHGPAFNLLAGMANEELKDMLDEAGLMVKRIKDVTPPAGPANAATGLVRELDPKRVGEPYTMKDPATQQPTQSDRLTEAEISRLRTDPSEPVPRDQPNQHSGPGQGVRSQAEIDSANRATADRDNAHRSAEAQRRQDTHANEIDRRSV